MTKLQDLLAVGLFCGLLALIGRTDSQSNKSDDDSGDDRNARIVYNLVGDEKYSVAVNEYGYDAYGFQPDAAARLFLPSALLYRYYFRAECSGIEKVPSGRVLLIANHAGQLPFDGVADVGGTEITAQKDLFRPIVQHAHAREKER